MTDEPRSDDDSTAPWHGRYLAHWGEETSLYEAVTDAVSTVSGEASSTVESQYDRAHAFALARLFGASDEGRSPSTGVVKFALAGCIVSVHSDGQLSVSPTDDTGYTQSSRGGPSV